MKMLICEITYCRDETQEMEFVRPHNNDRMRLFFAKDDYLDLDDNHTLITLPSDYPSKLSRKEIISRQADHIIKDDLISHGATSENLVIEFGKEGGFWLLFFAIDGEWVNQSDRRTVFMESHWTSSQLEQLKKTIFAKLGGSEASTND